MRQKRGHRPGDGRVMYEQRKLGLVNRAKMRKPGTRSKPERTTSKYKATGTEAQSVDVPMT